MRGRTQWLTSLAELPVPEAAEFLRSNWEEGTSEWVLSYVESLDADWVAAQTWGFQLVNGERRYARNVVVKKKGEKAEIRMVYDWVKE